MRTAAAAAIWSIALLALLAPTASARVAAKPWPPADGPGTLFVHFGEEHINDEDGATLLPKVVEESARYKPLLATMSGDKANNGNADEFELWAKAMEGFDKAGVAYYAGMGNHDRTEPIGGLFPFGEIAVYRDFFAKRPYPWGDGAPYPDDRIGPRTRPADDAAGAATHYYVDAGPVRWIFLDNSCWGLRNCDSMQAFADGDRSPQLDYLQAKGKEASDAGKLVFVVMHIPTRDPRDQSYTDTTAQNHVMGKIPGSTNDNALFESAARAAGVDGVFLGHIKGQFTYKGAGDIPYFIDGGAGGELYTTGPIGTDHGYWHGFRLIRVDGGRVAYTDTVPIFVPDGIRLEGPDRLDRGVEARFTAFGRQPTFKDTAKVLALELRNPAPRPKASAASLLGLPPQLVLWLLAPLGAFTLLGFAVLGGDRHAALGRRARVAGAAFGAGALAAAAFAGISLAQQSTPTSTPKEALPIPARVFTSGNPLVLAPVAGEADDPRRDAATQTVDGTFRAVCPGRTTMTVTSGFEETAKEVVVPSRTGRIVRSISQPPARARAGRRATVARIRLAQPAQVGVRILRAGKVVRVLERRCAGAGTLNVRWDGRVTAAGGKLRRAPRGSYTVYVRVDSDRVVRQQRGRIRVG